MEKEKWDHKRKSSSKKKDMHAVKFNCLREESSCKRQKVGGGLGLVIKDEQTP